MVTTQVIRSPRRSSSKDPATQAIVAGDFLFLAGILPLDRKTDEVVDGAVSTQVEKIFSNIRVTLSSQSLRLENLVKITIYLVSPKGNGMAAKELFSELDASLRSNFGDRIPAKTVLFVDYLPDGVRVCVDGIAYIERD